MLKLLKENPADLYLSFSHYLPFRRLKIPSVIAVSNLAPFYTKAFELERFYGKLRLFLLKRTIITSAKKAQKVIALSHMCKNILISHNIPVGKINVIPNGVNILSEKGAKRKKTDVPYILCVSHFYRYKNFEQLLRAYALLSEEIRKNYRLLIVGKFYDHKYGEEMTLLAKVLGIDGSVDFIPGLEPSKLSEVYSQASLFVFTSLIENSPNILLEAMSHSLPIISTDNDPMPEFGGSAIQYVKATDHIQLTTAIENIVSNQSLMENLSIQSKIRSKLFSWDKFIEDVIKLCRDVCDESQQSIDQKNTEFMRD